MDDDEPGAIHALFEAVNDEFQKFDRIAEVERPCGSPDVCAFLFLDRKFPSDRKIDMVSAVEHDQIWLRIEGDQLASLTENDVLYLVRCGVCHDDQYDGLYMLV